MTHELQAEASRRIAAEEALRRSEQRLAAQSEALTELTAPLSSASGRFRAIAPGKLERVDTVDLEDRLRVILETCARTLDASRASMWRFNEARDAIQCIDLYDSASASHTAGLTLQRDSFPQYFSALENERVIAAGNARTDRRTREFLDSYLIPNGIGAMLDVPLRQKDELIGVVCVEHVGGSRPWTIDERHFVISVANLVIMAIVDHDRRAAQRRLADSEARARLILDTAHDAFIGMDASGRIVAWNAQSAATFGWPAEEAIGRSLADTIIPESFRAAHTRGLSRFLSSGEAPVVNQRLELTALHRDGHEFPIEITITKPIPSDSGYFFGAFLRDISERREKEAELHRAKESAEAATRAKSEFLANMSHELRTPLNGVLGYTQLLQRERGLTPLQRESLDAIAKCGAHLLDLINDVLDLSKIEAGRVEVEHAPCDLRQVTVDVKYVVAEPAHRKGLRLLIDVGPDVPNRAVLDGRHLRQVLLNLLGNSVKFTASGEVRLSISAIASERLRFEVRDTGIGIDPEHLAEIFQAFGQTRDGAAAGGTGLGLTISQRLVRAMGGELQVSSAPGSGSRFYFDLPLVAAAESTSLQEPEIPEVMLDSRLAPGIELTALIADDSSVNRRILASLLESAGVRVITAAGGIEAIELARQHRPDVILMDLRMQDLDGFEATRRLRADSTTAHIPVLAVTASAFGDVRQAAVAAGCADFVPKPVRAERLFAKLQQHLGVKFVRHDAVSPQVAESAPAGVATLPAPMAARLHEAAAIGNVAALEALITELSAAGGQHAALGAHLSRLAAAFDYEGLAEIAASSAAGGGSI